MADPQKVKAGQVWIDDGMGYTMLVTKVTDTRIAWVADGASGQMPPDVWHRRCKPTPDPRDAVVAAARKACDRWKHREVPLYSELDTLLAALTALDAAKGST